MSAPAPRRLTPAGPPCPEPENASCMGRMAALEKSVRQLQQSNLELAEEVRNAIDESKRRSVSLDRLAASIFASDKGLALLKQSSGDLPTIPETKGKKL